MSLPPLPRVRPWYRRIAARVEPLRLFRSLYEHEPTAFLYESLEAHGGRGRYSFIGAHPRAVFRAWDDRIELRIGDRVHEDRGAPLDALRELNQLDEGAPPVAPFCGGAVGYLSYDAVRWCENIPRTNPDDTHVPDAQFIFPREVLCFDHLEKVVHVLLYQQKGHADRFAELRAAVLACPPESRRVIDLSQVDPGETVSLRSNVSQHEFEQMVEAAKEYILAGDIFQVVLSQRFEFDVRTAPLRLYEALRITNPSPYMYFLRLGGLEIVGSSPEILVRKIGRKVVTRPLAGTRRRGRTEAEDRALAAELQSDLKERAEHVMLVDLGRNDLGRVCEYGSIELSEVLSIERHSRVMHLVSNVEGWLREECDAFDVFRATFPAGTLTGAPKVRAMQIIEELEPVRRGVFGGAIGYFSVLGDVDMCIAIRTMVLVGDKGYIQAGAGIVADSSPVLEYKETLNKARAVARAVALAESDASLS
ncbi:MAG: anthranilate synthase component I [Planctomycetota bacterium]|nr:MAG: anthranilate synthase component I [Planctomycetota bacterium]